MKKINIMMLGGARRVSMAELFKRSGERIGREVNIVSYELMEQVPIAAVAKVVVGLRWADPNVVADIVKVATEYEIDIIVPFVSGAIEVASKVKQLMPNVFVPVGDSEVGRIMFDKKEAAMAFAKAGIPIPKTYTPINAKVPAIAKPRKGSQSRGIRIFHTLDELMQLEDYSNYLVQEYIENHDEYTVDCYVSQQGDILTVVPRVRLEVMGGEVTRTITCRNASLDRLSREVIEKFHLRGPVTLQFLHDLDRNRYLLMEVNPRLGGGVVCSIYAGAPITDYIIDESRGITLKPCEDWAYNTLMARYLKETIFYES